MTRTTLTPLIDPGIILSDTHDLGRGKVLAIGDRIQISEGPYVICSSGRRHKFGEKGRFIFHGKQTYPNGAIALLCQRPTDVRVIPVFITPREEQADSALGAITYRPYRIKKA